MNVAPDNARIPVKIEWHVPEGMPLSYATNFVVQHTDQEFVIGFYVVAPPLILGSDEERRLQIESMGSVRADCVARIVLSPQRMRELVDVIGQNWDRYIQENPAKVVENEG